MKRQTKGDDSVKRKGDYEIHWGAWKAIRMKRRMQHHRIVIAARLICN